MTHLTLSPTTALFRAAGLYTAIALCAFSDFAFAQTALQDSSFHQWEVSVDLKPLFRQDQPYTLSVKKYLTERKAIRFAIGTGNLISI